MDMKKLLSIVSAQKQPIVESVQQIKECGEPMPSTNIPSTPPVSMNVNMNAQGIDQIKELLNLMNATASNQMSAPSVLPAGGAPMPASAPVSMPTVGLDAPLSIEPAKAPTPDLGDLDDLIKNAGIGKKEEPAGDDKDAEEGTKEPMQSAAEEIRAMADKLSDKNEELANSPDEQVSDVDSVIPSGDDLHREKNQYAKAQDGDNPMSVESIRSQLDARYKELKEGKKEKPDYLDMDKDGDKKEPMKKAIKDKKVSEATEEDEDEDMEEGFEAGAKVGDTFKTAKGTATKTATGVRHTRDKYDYDPGSDDKDDKKMKRDAKKK